MPEGVLNDILSRLDTLEANSGQRPPANETLVPNYLTVDTLGRAGAVFTGFITALGLIMLGGLGAINQIRWLNGAGLPIGLLEAFEPITNGSQLDVESHSYGGQDSLARLLSFIDGGPSAQINTRASTVDANTSVVAQAFGSGPTITRKLIDAAGKSDYLQLGEIAGSVGAKKAIIDLAFPAFTWPGGSVGCTPFTVNYSVANASFAYFFAVPLQAAANCFAQLTASTVTSVTLVVTDPIGAPGAGTTGNCMVARIHD